MSTLTIRPVKGKLHRHRLRAEFVGLLAAYQDKAHCMEAYYWECDTTKGARVAKLREAFGLSYHQARNLSRIYEAAKKY